MPCLRNSYNTINVWRNFHLYILKHASVKQSNTVEAKVTRNDRIVLHYMIWLKTASGVTNHTTYQFVIAIQPLQSTMFALRVIILSVFQIPFDVLSVFSFLVSTFWPWYVWIYLIIKLKINIYIATIVRFRKNRFVSSPTKLGTSVCMHKIWKLISTANGKTPKPFEGVEQGKQASKVHAPVLFDNGIFGYLKTFEIRFNS